MAEDDNVHRKAEEVNVETEEDDEDEGIRGRVLFATGLGGGTDSCILGFDGEGMEDVLGNRDVYLADHVESLPDEVGFYVWEGDVYPGSCEQWAGTWRRASRDDFEDMAPRLITPLYVPVRKVLRSA